MKLSLFIFRAISEQYLTKTSALEYNDNVYILGGETSESGTKKESKNLWRMVNIGHKKDVDTIELRNYYNEEVPTNIDAAFFHWHNKSNPFMVAYDGGYTNVSNKVVVSKFPVISTRVNNEWDPDKVIADNLPSTRMAIGWAVSELDQLYVFGGLKKEGNAAVINNEFYVYDNALVEWKTLEVPEDVPKMAHHKMLMHANDTIYFIGGIVEPKMEDVSIFQYSIKTNKFNKLETEGLTAEEYVGITGFSAHLYKDDIVILGGINDKNKFNKKLWRLNINKLKWTIEPIYQEDGSEFEIGRKEHSAIVNKNVLVSFFGYYEDKEVRKIQAINLDTNTIQSTLQLEVRNLTAPIKTKTTMKYNYYAWDFINTNIYSLTFLLCGWWFIESDKVKKYQHKREDQEIFILWADTITGFVSQYATAFSNSAGTFFSINEDDYLIDSIMNIETTELTNEERVNFDTYTLHSSGIYFK